MADFAKLVRGGVAIANKLTASLQPEVTVIKAASTDVAGDVTPGATYHWPALVDWKAERRRTPEGTEVTSRAVITFTEPRPITEEDTIILPDGTTGPILDLGGFVDKGTGRPFVLDVYLG